MEQDVLQRFRGLGPFTLDELVEAANTVLQRKGAEPLTRRTVRYYIVEGLVPQAEGPPKFARYTFDHLVAVVATRALQDEGLTLDEIRREMRELRISERIASRATRWLDQPGPARRSAANWYPDAALLQRLSTAPPAGPPTPPSPDVGHPVRRIPLSPDLTLELREGADLTTALREVINKLIEMMTGRT